MRNTGRLNSLLKNCEAGERRALEQLARVNRVLETRKIEVESIRSRKSELEKELHDVRGGARLGAIRRGDLEKVAALTRYGRRLEVELKRIESSLIEQEKDHSRAVERSKSAEQELVEARIERRKIEILIGNQVRSERIQRSALEEEHGDDTTPRRGYFS